MNTAQLHRLIDHLRFSERTGADVSVTPDQAGNGVVSISYDGVLCDVAVDEGSGQGMHWFLSSRARRGTDLRKIYRCVLGA